MKRASTVLLIPYFVLCCGLCSAWSARPFAELLPRTTKAVFSIPDVHDARDRWDRTELGKLTADPVMEPFTDDLRSQIRDKLIRSSFNVSLDWDEMVEACSGELCFAGIQPNNDEKQHAAMLMMDVTDRLPAAQKVLDRLAKQLQEKNATRTVKTVGDYQLVLHDVPRERGEAEATRVVRVMTSDTLVISNHEEVMMEVLANLSSGSTGDTLSAVSAYRFVQQRVAAEAEGMSVQATWYVEPFAYAQVIRAARRGPKKRRKDILSILRTQGFDAIQAVGGIVHLATDKHEMLHRTMVFAPPLEGEEAKYRLAARMLEFPNDETWDWGPWIPRDLASAVSFRWKLQEAFEYSKTLVDAIAGDEGFFDDLLSSIKEDPNGPKIDVRTQFVRFLGTEVTVIGDYVYPITPQSDRLIFAIAVTDEQAVRETVLKTLEKDPEARQLEVEGYTVWEIIDQDDEESPDLDLDLEGIDPIGDAPVEEEEEERILPNSAVTVAHGHLLVSTHVDFLRRILKDRAEDDQLRQSEDFRRVAKQLDELGAGTDSFRSFTRTDEAYRPTYELLKQGRMPESESLLGKLLNRILGPDDDTVLREQRIDGSQLPDYQAVRRYLGPAGIFVRSEDEGWYVTGVLLKKQQSVAASEASDEPGSTARHDHTPPAETR